MSSSIVPSSQVPRDEVTAYLVGQGHAPEIVAWKYFDEAFNEGRNRGWAWLKDGRVAGFIGFLPFEIGRGSQRIGARWLCDWSIEDFAAHRGAGVRLFKRALQDGLHFVLGGNANSLAPMEKMASRTRHAADIEMRLFLRAGAVLERLGSRVPGVSALSRGPLGKMVLPRPRKAASRETSVEVLVEPGVAPALSELLESPGVEFSAVYDHKYLSWQIGRCPTLNSWTIAAADNTYLPHAGAVLWHPKASARVWRAALWLSPFVTSKPQQQAARAVLEAAIAHVLAHGGSELSILASRSDASTLGILRACGFAATKAARPLFVFDGPQPGIDFDDLHGLSFLSADLSYRF